MFIEITQFSLILQELNKIYGIIHSSPANCSGELAFIAGNFNFLPSTIDAMQKRQPLADGIKIFRHLYCFSRRF